MPQIDVYTANYCPFCTRAKDLLKKKGAEFTEHDITTDQEQRMKVSEMAGGQKTVPQIFIDGEHIGGFDDLAALDKSGELDKKLA